MSNPPQLAPASETTRLESVLGDALRRADGLGPAPPVGRAARTDWELEAQSLLVRVTPVISVCVRILMLLVLDSHSRDQGAVAGRRPQ